MPVLRRGLLAAGNPLSVAFWDSAVRHLSAIEQGSATIDSVRSWLEATGTEPVDFLELGVFWEDAEARLPIAREMHGLLVSHLESLLADGVIDPDPLLAGDAAALAAQRERQRTWLTSHLPDGRIPAEEIELEQDESFLAAWEDADRDARQVLDTLLEGEADRACPGAELAATAARLREELAGGAPGSALLRAAGGVDPAHLPQDDAELWLTLASGVVAQQDVPPTDEFDGEVLSAWAALQHADWIAAAVVLARRGPGTEVTVEGLARDMVSFDFPADLVDGDEGWPDDPLAEDDEASVVSLRLLPVLRLWGQLGVLDTDDRLTELGSWGIPESLRRAWSSTGDSSTGASTTGNSTSGNSTSGDGNR